jgi:hypothetical protein
MRILLVAFAFLACAAPPQSSLAEDLTFAPSHEMATKPPEKSRLSKLLQGLGVNLISRAHAAECTEEGEICTSNEQCCSGLECAGGPPTTCVAED